MPLLIYDKPHLSEIEPGLFIGDFTSSSQPSILKENGITAIVSLATNKSEEWNRPANRDLVPEDKHMFVYCADSSTQDILVLLPDICDFINKHSSTQTAEQGPAHSDGQQNNVLVHCTAGVSRSASIVIAYLMRKYRQGLDSILKQVKERRRIEPIGNFMDQLRIWEEVGYEPWEDEARKKAKAAYREFLGRQEHQSQAKAKLHAYHSRRLRGDTLADAMPEDQSRSFTVMYAHHHAQ